MISVILFIASVWLTLALWVFRKVIFQAFKNLIKKVKDLETDE